MKNNSPFFYEVKVEDYPLSSNETIATHCSKQVVVVDPNGDRKIVHTASPEYGLVPNNDLFPLINHFLNEKGVIFEATYHTGTCGARFFADYRLPSSNFTIKNERGGIDIIEAMVRITNSYNGRLIFSCSIGLFRLICSNGLVGLVMETNKELKHTTGNIQDLAKNVVAFIDQAIINYEGLRQKAIEMSKKIYTKEWLSVCEVLCTQLKLSKNKFEKIVTKLHSEIVKHELDPSLWVIANCIQSEIWSNKKTSFEIKIAMETQLFKLCEKI